MGVLDEVPILILQGSRWILTYGLLVIGSHEAILALDHLGGCLPVTLNAKLDALSFLREVLLEVCLSGLDILLVVAIRLGQVIVRSIGHLFQCVAAQDADILVLGCYQARLYLLF